MARPHHKERLLGWGVEQTKPATLSIALPLLEGAADEDREELVDLWARLLANAMNPRLKSVRQSFIDAVRKMDPVDAIVLRFIHGSNIAVAHVGRAPDFVNLTTGVENIAVELGRRNDEVEASLRHLKELLFLDDMVGNPGWHVVNATTREFLRPCHPEIK